MSSESSNTLSPAGGDSPSAEVRGGDLRVSLACPKCDHAGWIAWQNLGRAIRCPECKCQFHFGRLGKLELRPDTPRVRYECPRCLQSVVLPSHATVRGVECTACQLTLVVGPDQKLHDRQEAAQLRKTRRVQSDAARTASKHELAGNAWYFQPAKFLAGVGLLLAVLTLGFVGLRMLGGTSPDRRVAAFTAECLAGDWQDALEYVIDDPVQQAEFARWRVRHFASILDEHRPSGDRMDIQPELEHESPAANTYRVMLSSKQVGKRAHQQIWQVANGQWHFDVCATLSLTDRVAASSSEETPDSVLPRGTKPRSIPSKPKPKPRLPNNPYSRLR